MRLALQRRLDGQIVEVEDLGQDPPFLVGRFGQVDPHRAAAVRAQPGGVDGAFLSSRAMLVHEDANHRAAVQLHGRQGRLEPGLVAQAAKARIHGQHVHPRAVLANTGFNPVERLPALAERGGQIGELHRWDVLARGAHGQRR